MHSYLQLLNEVLTRGTRQSNRTGIDTLRIPPRMFQHEMKRHFPLITTRKLNTAGLVGEVISFLRGYDNAKDFAALGCPFWNADADTNPAWLLNPARKGPGDLGRIYGKQWRGWNAPNGETIDQIANLVQLIETDPTNRRMIVTAWNPDEINKTALPPCHPMFRVSADVTRRELSLTWYQRSCDVFIGVPYNIAAYGLLLEILCAATGYLPGILTGFLDDVHIYANNIEQAQEQLKRSPVEKQPYILLQSVVKGIDLVNTITPENIMFLDYFPLDKIVAPLNVGAVATKSS